jgi:CsoR family transcriptional regulator, copper-sensing transcriptional repressor
MPENTVACACGAQHHGGPHAAAVDPEIKRSVLTRLRRIEGQVRGLQKMVEEERYCAEVLTQVSSVHEALRGVGRAMLHNHLRHCATEAIGSGDRERAETMYDELMDLIYRSVR